MFKGLGCGAACGFGAGVVDRMGWLARAFGGGARGPRDLDSEVCSALLSVLDQNLDRAEETLVRALRSDADGFESYLALARLYRMRGEIGRAIRVHQNL